MNCLYISVFFNIVAGIVQTFIKSWNQLRYPRVIEVGRQPFEPRHDFLLHLIIVVELFLSEMFLQARKQVEMFHLQSQWSPETIHSTFASRNHITDAPRIWRDFGSALPFQTRLTQTKPVLPLSNEHGLQVKDQGRRQCCHNKHKKFPY